MKNSIKLIAIICTAIIFVAANVAMAKANEPAIYAPRVELSLVELKTKQRQVDFIDNVSTLSS